VTSRDQTRDPNPGTDDESVRRAGDRLFFFGRHVDPAFLRFPRRFRYRFVGVARYDDLPGYIRDRAAFLTGCDGRGRPPPSAAIGGCDYDDPGGRQLLLRRRLK